MKKRFKEGWSAAVAVVLAIVVAVGIFSLGTGLQPSPEPLTQPPRSTTSSDGAAPRLEPLLAALGMIGGASGLESQQRPSYALIDPADGKRLSSPLQARQLARHARESAGQSAGDLARAEQLVEQGGDGGWACAECHGSDGAGQGLIPRLAGLPVGYLAKQLHDYRDGLRRDASMELVAASLEGKDILSLARYFASRETPPSAAPRLGGNLDRGRTLAYDGDWSVDVPACFACHGSLAWGVDDIFPPLAGQHPVYVVRQLDAWIDGSRANAPVRLMHGVSFGLSHRDRQAVADFLATLPPPPAQELSTKEDDDV